MRLNLVCEEGRAGALEAGQQGGVAQQQVEAGGDAGGGAAQGQGGQVLHQVEVELLQPREQRAADLTRAVVPPPPHHHARVDDAELGQAGARLAHLQHVCQCHVSPARVLVSSPGRCPRQTGCSPDTAWSDLLRSTAGCPPGNWKRARQ